MTAREKWIDLLLRRGLSPDEAIAEVKKLESFCCLDGDAPQLSAIIQLVGNRFQAPVGWATTQRRAKSSALPRQVSYWLARELTPLSLPQIGRRFGGRDHATIMHGIRRVEEMRARDPNFNAGLAEMVEMLSPGFRAQTL